MEPFSLLLALLEEAQSRKLWATLSLRCVESGQPVMVCSYFISPYNWKGYFAPTNFECLTIEEAANLLARILDFPC